MCVCHGRTLFRLVFVIYGGPQLSYQNQMLTANYKSFTAKRSEQIQIAHSKFKSLAANCKLLTANYKSLTANYNFKWTTVNSTRSQQIKVAHSKFKGLPFCRGYFFECRGTLSRVPILQRGNLISNFLDVYNAYNVRRISIQLRIDYPWGLSIMPKIPEILVGIQMERSVSVSSVRNIRDHLWRWSTYFGWNIPIEILRSI